MNEEIISKLQKILALANGRGATQGEMEAAMARAKEIAMKHGIELAALPARAENKSRLDEVKAHNTGLKTSTRYEHPYHNWVMTSLQEVFQVRFLFTRGRIGSHPYLTNIWLLGTETDVALASTLFPWLEDLFPKLFWKEVKAYRLRNNFANQNGFYMGLCRGISEANKREEAKLSATDQNQWALIVRSKQDAVTELLNKMYPPKQDSEKDTKVQKSRKRYNGEAYAKGTAKGAEINLNQLDASKTRPALPSK